MAQLSKLQLKGAYVLSNQEMKQIEGGDVPANLNDYCCSLIRIDKTNWPPGDPNWEGYNYGMAQCSKYGFFDGPKEMTICASVVDELE